MTILNMVSYSSGGSNIGEPTNLSVVISGTTATIKWTDNDLNAIPPSTFQKSVLVRKVGSAPTSPSDGTVVVTETTKNTYSSSGYADTGLTSWTTYYYRVYSYSSTGGITYGSAVSATTGWVPGANTILYMPLDSTNTTTDLSSNHNNGTINGTLNFGTNLGVNCGAFLNSGYITIPYSSSMSTSNITISCWCAIASGYSSNNGGIIAKTALTGGHGAYHISNMNNLRFNINKDSASVIGNGFSGNNIWTNIVCTYDGATLKLYSNNSLLGTTSYTYNISGDTNQLVLGAYYSSAYKMNGYLSKVIVENKVWTAQEISDYYNSTKSNYGL